MASYQSIEAGTLLPRGFPLVAKASGGPISAGTVNYHLKALTGANAGKWWRKSDNTWQAVETANAMTYEDADGNWSLALTDSPFTDGIAYLEYAKESGDLHIPAQRWLIGEYTPSADANRRMDLGLIEGADATDTLDARSQVGAAAALTAYDPPTRTEATSDKAEILAAIPTPPTASAIADQVWDEALSGHLTAGSTGAALNAANAPTAAAVADAVWDEALSGHTTAGTAGKALSDAATGGTVTISYSQVALALAAAVSAGTITLRRGDRISLQITGLGVLPAGRDKLWFTVKSAPVSQADSASIIQVTETGGLLYLNGLVPGTASTEVSALTSADGSLTVDDATDGDVTLVLSAAASALLAQRQSLAYDLQYQDGSTVTTLAQGIANVVADVTRAVS